MKIYDLGEELNIEGENVLDYGTYNGLSKNETAELLKAFVETYSEYLGEDVEIYLLIGDEDSLIVIGQEGLENDLEIDFGISGDAIKRFATKEYFPKGKDSIIGNKIKVKIRENEYEFELKQGENFYFIISQKVGEEKHVATSQS